MSEQDGTIMLAWGDGEHAFRIAFGQWHELQEAINRPRLAVGEPPIGPMTLLRALATGDAWPSDIREVLRLGLIGAGMKSDRALVLIKRHVENKPAFENVPTARAVLQRAMFGPPGDQAGKERGPATTETPEPSRSNSPQSTGSVLQ